jgi:hypothetical protein
MLQARPLSSIASASRQLSLTVPTVTASFKQLEKLGVVRETTGAKYGRLNAYSRYLEILNAGMEPIAPRV